MKMDSGEIVLEKPIATGAFPGATGSVFDFDRAHYPRFYDGHAECPAGEMLAAGQPSAVSFTACPPAQAGTNHDTASFWPWKGTKFRLRGFVFEAS
jgi:hypothetical protein